MDSELSKKYFEAVIFDLNGTVIEIFKLSEYDYHLEQMAAVLGMEEPVFRDIWYKSWQHYSNGNYPSVDHRLRLALDTYHSKKSTEYSEETLKSAVDIRFNYIKNQHFKIKPGTLDTLQWLKDNNYKVGMISNCSAETHQTWNENPMSKYIPRPTFSSQVNLSKPDPEIFKHEINRLDIKDPRKAIYVADGDDNELETAQSFGMTPILVTYDLEDAFRHEPFPESKYKIDNMNDLPQLIENLEKMK